MACLQAWRPAKIRLVADGPKDSGEADLCQESRREAESAVRWPCELRRVYADTNLGLKKRIESGLDEVFCREIEAVILEEDVQPGADFFPFCSEMLARYRAEPRVGAISGNCFLPQNQPVTSDYYYSKYLHVWGWATWARAWRSYDRPRWTWPDGGFHELFPEADPGEAAYWNRCFSRMASGQLASWAYGLMAWFWMHGWISITPAQNLVRNIGFGPGATNTRDEAVETGLEREENLCPPFQGPATIRADADLDRIVFRHHLLRQEGRLPFWPRLQRSLRKRIRA